MDASTLIQYFSCSTPTVSRVYDPPPSLVHYIASILVSHPILLKPDHQTCAAGPRACDCSAAHLWTKFPMLCSAPFAQPRHLTEADPLNAASYFLTRRGDAIRLFNRLGCFGSVLTTRARLPQLLDGAAAMGGVGEGTTVRYSARLL